VTPLLLAKTPSHSEDWGRPEFAAPQTVVAGKIFSFLFLSLMHPGRCFR
jgi:hypothetical protein